MKIVILDGGTANPGDISWAPVERLAATAVYGETPAPLVKERMGAAEVMVMNRVVMSRRVMEELPALKLIATLATGYNTIDIQAAKELGITVCNVPLYCAETVAQTAFSLILELCTKIGLHNGNVKNGKWSESAAACGSALPLTELWGKTLGILGGGSIGLKTAAIGKAFGMNILIHSRSERFPEAGKYVSLPELLEKSDVVSVHCPLNDSTRGLLDAKAFSRMKSTALIVNTARGAIIDEEALAKALNNGTVAGAGLDVMTTEPPLPNNPLLKAKNCIITPHIGWASREARIRLVQTVSENIEAYFNGTPQNVVNE